MAEQPKPKKTRVKSKDGAKKRGEKSQDKPPSEENVEPESNNKGKTPTGPSPHKAKTGKKVPRKKGKKGAHESNMIKIGVEVGAAVYMRCAKDRKISVNTASKEFIEHLESPAPGCLTGGQLPYTPMNVFRGFRSGLMDRVLACGPSRDPVLHRGMPAVKTNLPIALPFSIDLVVLLTIPIAPQMATKDREILQLVQAVARHHHSGYADDFEQVVEEMTRLAEILEGRNDTANRTVVLSSLMTKKNLSQKSQKQIFNALGGDVEIDREQVDSVLSQLRSRDQLSRDQAARIRDDLSTAVHDRRNGKIRAGELIRKIIKVKEL
uniref:GatB_Yqey domain-containing protein n=1 Tax=Panagrellus redivivus TaxID=6233 RepID=A0A7E4URU9_PANRE